MRQLKHRLGRTTRAILFASAALLVMIASVQADDDDTQYNGKEFELAIKRSVKENVDTKIKTSKGSVLAVKNLEWIDTGQWKVFINGAWGTDSNRIQILTYPGIMVNHGDRFEYVFYGQPVPEHLVQGIRNHNGMLKAEKAWKKKYKDVSFDVGVDGNRITLKVAGSYANGLKERHLVERMKSLPSKRKLKDVVEYLSTYRDRVEKSRVRFSEVTRVLQAVERISGDAKLAKARSDAKQAATKARKLRRELTQAKSDDEIIDSIKRKATENAVIAIDDLTAAASREARDQWRRDLERRLKPFTELRDVAVQCGLPGGAELSRVLILLETQLDSPPQSVNDADAIQATMNEARQALGQLGIEGKTGEFLKAAASGKGDPRKLFDAEVKTYFDERNLWELLRVSFR